MIEDLTTTTRPRTPQRTEHPVVGSEERGQGGDHQQGDPAQLADLPGRDQSERRDQGEHDGTSGRRERLGARGDTG